MLTFAAVAIIVSAALGAVTLFSSNATQTTATTSENYCGAPQYMVTLASQVQASQKFIDQSHGLSYVFFTGDNESGTTGISNGKPFRTPPATSLDFESYGAKPVNACPSVLGSKGVVGVLLVRVPINPDKSYDLANMTVSFYPGLFPNTTAIG